MKPGHTETTPVIGRLIASFWTNQRAVGIVGLVLTLLVYASAF